MLRHVVFLVRGTCEWRCVWGIDVMTKTRENRRLRHVVFLVRGTCEWRCVWGIDVMTKTRENRSTRKKLYPIASMSNRHLTWTDLGSHPSSRTKSPTINSLGPCTPSLKIKHNPVYLKIHFVPRSKRIRSRFFEVHKNPEIHFANEIQNFWLSHLVVHEATAGPLSAMPISDRRHNIQILLHSLSFETGIHQKP